MVEKFEGVCKLEMPVLCTMKTIPSLGVEKPDDILLKPANPQWFQAKTIHRGVQTADAREPALFATVEATDQKGAEGERQPCGVHTIHNGWALAIGLGHRINPGCRLVEQDYLEAIAVIQLALSGHCDFWLIYCFMLKTKFIHGSPPRKWPVTRAADLSEEDGKISDALIDNLHKILSVDGVKIFDRTLAIQGEGRNFWSKRMEKEVKKEQDTREQRIMDGLSGTENSEVFELIDKQTSPDNSELAAGLALSTQQFKHKIEARLFGLLKKQYKDKDATKEPTEAQITEVIRRCHNLAFLVQDISPLHATGQEETAESKFCRIWL